MTGRHACTAIGRDQALLEREIAFKAVDDGCEASTEQHVKRSKYGKEVRSGPRKDGHAWHWLKSQ